MINLNDLFKKEFIIPVLISPLAAILFGMLIVSCVSALFYIFQPLQLNTASVIALLFWLPTYGLGIAYLITFGIILPMVFWLNRSKKLNQWVLYTIGFSFALSASVIMCVFGAPVSLALFHFVLLFLPCFILGFFVFWHIHKRFKH